MGNGENGENEAESIRGVGEARELMYMGKGSGFLRCLKRPEITDQEKRQIAQNCHGQNYSNLKGSNKGIRIKAQDWDFGEKFSQQIVVFAARQRFCPTLVLFSAAEILFGKDLLVARHESCRMPMPSFQPLSRENSDISAIALLLSCLSHFPSLFRCNRAGR